VLQAAATNDTTFLCKSVNTTSPDYQNNVIVYLKAPITSTQTPTSAVFQLNQYKCYPFSELHNVTSDASGIAMVDAVDAMKNADPAPSIGIFVLVILFILAGIGVFVAIIRYLMTAPDLPPDMLAAAAALPVV
jgi:hypothetical protein